MTGATASATGEDGGAGEHASCSEPLLQAVGELKHGEPDKRLWPEAKKVLALSLPISLSEVLSFTAYLITTAQVGRLGARELSGITLAHSFYHITGLSLIVGMASAVETFCGQAYGAGRYSALGVVLQRAVLLCLVTSVVPLALLARAEPIMRAMGQKEEMVALASRYVGLLSPVLLVWSVNVCIKSYLSSQGVVAPLALVSGAYTALTPLLNYAFMFGAGWGMMGAAVAYNAAQLAELGLLVAAMAWLHHARQAPGRRTWGGFSRAAFRGWGTYLKVALPSLAAICLDWWSYEAVVLLAGLLPDAKLQLGAMGIAFSTHALLFMVVEGFSAAASTRVSNELGAGSGPAARHAFVVALALGVAAPLLLCALLVAFPGAWARLYTRDEGVVVLVVRLMPLLALSNASDSCVSVLGGVLRGSGRQELAFRVNLGVFWVLGLPAAATLALRYRMGVMGLWAALAAAGILQAAIMLACVLRFDWPEEARRAARRVQRAALADHRPSAAAGTQQQAAAAAAAAGTALSAAEEGGALLATAAAAAAGGGPGGRAAAEAPTEAAAGGEGEAEAPVPHPPVHYGQGSRHGVYEPLLTAPHPPV